MKIKEPNPLNVLGARQTDVLPPSFTVTTTAFTSSTEKKITQWIYLNCKGRFYATKGVELIEGSIQTVLKIGF